MLISMFIEVENEGGKFFKYLYSTTAKKPSEQKRNASIHTGYSYNLLNKPAKLDPSTQFIFVFLFMWFAFLKYRLR